MNNMTAEIDKSEIDKTTTEVDKAEIDKTTTEVDKTAEEFSYTQRDEFTSEIYKVEVRNLGIFGIKEFKKLLRNQFSLDACKIKSPKRRDFAYVCFRCEEDQEKAINNLNDFIWKGKRLKVNKAKAVPDPLVKRRQERDGGGPSKKRKTAVEATCPLYNLPYDEQLSKKESEMKVVLNQYARELSRINPSLRKNFVAGLPCVFKGIKPAPKIEGYRNKSEFAIGKNADGEIVVGFRLGSYADGSVEVGGLDGLPHIPKKVKKAAKTFEEYLRKTKFEVFNPEHNSGHFRQLSARSSEENDEIMLIVGVYSANLSEDQLVELKTEVKDFYSNYDKNEFVCTSLYYQDLKRKESGQLSNPVEHLSGTTHIYDVIQGLKFRISPLAFFQVNTQGAGLLYQVALELANVQPHTTVLDICCGIGTISLCLSRYCKQVLGVEIIPEAVNDADFNAKENSVENCKFYAGNADDYIQSMVKEATYNCNDKNELDLVAIVDPPRAGLHNRSIQAIRSAKGFKRLVYLSCNPRSAHRNWIDLARPRSKAYKGAPFVPKCAIAVDMFPHTAHTEMVILFERVEYQDETESDNQENVSVDQETGIYKEDVEFQAVE